MIRKIIFLILYIFYGINRIFRKPREVAVLMYHSIGNSDWFFAVTPREFEKQIDYLARNKTPVTLGAILDFINGKRDLPPDAVAVTFDDGYRDFLLNAMPILQKHQIPVTLFVSGGEVIRSELGSELELLSRDDIVRASRVMRIEVGSHAITHKKLSFISNEDARFEIINSRENIKAWTGIVPRFFAYPKGSYSDETKKIVRDAGYEGAVTAYQYLVKRACGPYEIPRIQVDSSLGFFEFKVRLTKVADWYSWLRRLLYI